jgi:anaerobic ribonucleoside-triphosphate reductase activating protein
MFIRIAGVEPESIVDGPGFRFTVFTQGCFHDCPGCHNPETHDPNGGKAVTVESLLTAMRKNPLLDGLTLSGGEPFLQVEPCICLAGEARELGLNVWAYSGYTFEELEADPAKRRLLEACDVLVDGPFLLQERTLEKRFRGSRNQRVIDIKKTLERGEIVLEET